MFRPVWARIGPHRLRLATRRSRASRALSVWTTSERTGGWPFQGHGHELPRGDAPSYLRLIEHHGSFE
jgi:hypothetical protein